MRQFVSLIVLGWLVAAGTAAAQSPPDTTQPGPPPADAAPADTTRPWHDAAWTPIITHQGVTFSYIFYSEADNHNNGVVIRLENQNAYPVRYRFTVVFRTPDAERTARAEGGLAPGQMKTGENDGLFWIPFKDGRSIGELGLRGFEVTPDHAGS